MEVEGRREAIFCTILQNLNLSIGGYKVNNFIPGGRYAQHSLTDKYLHGACKTMIRLILLEKTALLRKKMQLWI